MLLKNIATNKREPVTRDNTTRHEPVTRDNLEVTRDTVRRSHESNTGTGTRTIEIPSAPNGAARSAAELSLFERDENLALRCGPFAGLLAPVDRSALAEEIAGEAIDLDEAHEAEPSRFTTERGLAANIVARRIVAARELNGLTQGELARALGHRNQTQVALWEGAKRLPPLPGLIATADVLAVSLDYITGRSDDPERDARAARRNSCLRAVRTVLTAAAERIASAFDGDEQVLGAGTADIRALVQEADACIAHSGRARSGKVAGPALLDALDRLEGASLRVAIRLRQHDDEEARQRERLAEIAANDAD
jgi:transcriptional regulator with XRE-family HTH domain